jgi:hypothetical protein
MSAEKYQHYLAGGSTLAAVNAFRGLISEAAKSVEALKAEFGAIGTANSMGRIRGLIFDPGNEPKGWRSDRCADGTKFFFPYRKTKADKAICARFAAARLPSGDRLGEMIGMGYQGVVTTDQGAGFGMVIRYPAYQALADDRVILSIPLSGRPDDNGFIPADCTPLKLSEYFALIEAEEEQRSEAA